MRFLQCILDAIRVIVFQVSRTDCYKIVNFTVTNLMKNLENEKNDYVL